MFSCNCQNTIVKNLQRSKFITESVVKMLAFQSIVDCIIIPYNILNLASSKIEIIDTEIQLRKRAKFKRINYISNAFTNIHYKWITQNAYQIYKRKQDEQYIILLHLINQKYDTLY